MYRLLLVPLVVLVVAPFAPAKRIAAPPNPVQRALQAEVVVVGKVTAIEKETVEVADSPGAAKVAYKIAVIKIESNLAGAGSTTHVKVGFLPPAPNAPLGRGRPLVALAEGQEGVFFLSKHPSGQFSSFNWMSTPVESSAENYKATVENVKKALAAVADPAKALKADKAEDRAFAALALIVKYRTAPNTGAEVESVKVPAAESQLILKSLAEADWTKAGADVPAPANAFYLLGLTPENGWVPPKAIPGADFNAEMGKAFAKWLGGPGKDYQIARLVPKGK